MTRNRQIACANWAARILAVAWMLWAAAGLAQIGNFKPKIDTLQGRTTLSPQNPARQVLIDIQTFECLNADEDTPLSNGDEPYLYVSSYWLDGTTINLESLGTATVRRRGRYPLQGNLGRKGIKGGDVVGVPRKVGHIEETMLPIVPTADFPKGVPAQVALAIVACEQDQSDEATTEESLDREFRDVLDQMTSAVRTMSPVTAPDLGNALLRNIKRRILALRMNNPLAVIDPDDLVGTEFAVWSLDDIVRAGATGIPFAMEFKRLGVHYRIKGAVRLNVPVGRRTVTLTIRQVRAIDDLEGFGRGDPDFQARVTISGRTIMSPEKSGKTINPYWTFAVPASSIEVPITIELFERDGLGADEHCDINPRKGLRSLSFRYNILTGQVTGDALGNANNGLTSQGIGDDEKCEIRFAVLTSDR